VAAARAAGLGLVVGVDERGRTDALLAVGADVAFRGLADVLERSLDAPV
jgi:hypothetical protein